MKFHVKPLSVLKSETKLKIIKFLLSHEAAMSEREIASVVKTSHMSVNRTLQELAELNLVNYIAVGKAHLWKVNRSSYVYRIFDKLFASLEDGFDPLSELKQVILNGLSVKDVERVVIFGSIAKNKESSDSDIDVFILTKNIENQKKVETVIDQLSNECLELFGNRLSPYVLTQQQYKQKKDSELIQEINKGIAIYPNPGD